MFNLRGLHVSVNGQPERQSYHLVVEMGIKILGSANNVKCDFIFPSLAWNNNGAQSFEITRSI